MKHSLNLLFLLLLLIFTSFVVKQHKTTVYLIGDSTMSIKTESAFPETGWGMPFKVFFDSTVAVDNRAKNGRSTKTFINEGLWDAVSQSLKPGDYVFIQFGHNDAAKEKTERYTTPEEYSRNLIRFINETKQKKAIPVLLTPVSRRKFTDGKSVETHEVYSAIVRRIAKEEEVYFIDLDRESMKLYQEFGEEKSKLLFLQLQPGEHPNYPDGKNDNTHFSELGARLIAQIVLREIKNMNMELANRVARPVRKK